MFVLGRVIWTTHNADDVIHGTRQRMLGVVAVNDIDEWCSSSVTPEEGIKTTPTVDGSEILR